MPRPPSASASTSRKPARTRPYSHRQSRLKYPRCSNPSSETRFRKQPINSAKSSPLFSSKYITAMPALLRKLLPALTLAAMLTACESVDDDRIPYAEVHLTFHTVGDWNIYGVQGDAASSRTYIFNSKERVPSNFPYTTLDRTGYGGLLLVTRRARRPPRLRPRMSVRSTPKRPRVHSRRRTLRPLPIVREHVRRVPEPWQPHLRPGTGTGLRPQTLLGRLGRSDRISRRDPLNNSPRHSGLNV